MQGLSMMGILNELFMKRFRKRKGNEMHGGKSLQSVNRNAAKRERINKRMEADEQQRARERQNRKMTIRQALELIVENSNCPALNYAVNYAKYALGLEADGQLAELRVQLLYVICNLSHWRAGSTTTATAKQIKECRAVLKAACK